MVLRSVQTLKKEQHVRSRENSFTRIVLIPHGERSYSKYNP